MQENPLPPSSTSSFIDQAIIQRGLEDPKIRNVVLKVMKQKQGLLAQWLHIVAVSS